MSTTTEYQVTGMTCGHCEMSVREEVSEIPGGRAACTDCPGSFPRPVCSAPDGPDPIER